MKRFTKVALTIAAVMAVIGVICITASFAMGMTMDTIFDMAEEGKFNFRFVNEKFVRVENSKSSVEIDAGYENLEIDFAVGEFVITYDDVEQIQIEQKNVPDFEAYVEENTIHIKGEAKANNNLGVSIIITLPNDIKFQKVDLELGASEADIEGISANTVNIEVGAGNAHIAYLDTEKLDMETGVGEIALMLAGKESDYNYKVECGIGEVAIGNNSYGAFATTQNITNPGATRFMDIECGIGEIQIDFYEGGF